MSDRATNFLQLIRRSQRGRLKIYLGYGPGVGKTYLMLQEAQRLKSEGIDVVVGIVETHGRVETARLLEGLTVISRRRTEYRGIVVEEMDLAAILARKPQVALVDELAHSNVPGSGNDKRYQDVTDLLAAGIHVISTLNVQHLESLYNTVQALVGVKVRERLPDAVLAEADEVINVDLSAEDLRRRVQEGKVYPRQRVATALENYFQAGNLEQLRELTMREIAAQLDSRRRESKPAPGEDRDGAPDQIMVCLASRGPNSASLLRYASRLAGRLNRNWYAVYVQTPSEEPTAIDAITQRLLGDTLTLANQLGATVFTFKGQDVADTLLRFAKEYRVGQIVIGKPGPRVWWKRLLGMPTVAEQLIRQASGVTVAVVDADAEQPAPPATAIAAPVQASGSSAGLRATLAGVLDVERMVIWDEPASRDQIFRRLIEAIGRQMPGLNVDAALARVQERESQGSTFLNEGVALPHARVEGLALPIAALGLTHAGVFDATTDNQVEAVFLLLSPVSGAVSHLQVLAAAGRALQNRDLRKNLRGAKSAADAMEAVLTL